MATFNQQGQTVTNQFNCVAPKGKLWSYEKPIKPGLYYVNRGDVVTRNSLEISLFS